MPAITPAISRAFIDTVRLPRRARRVSGDEPPLELHATDPQALVVGCGLVAAAENVPAAARQDLVDCTLFAQLAATAAVADPADTVGWYRAYFGALTALGWAQSDTHLEAYEFHSKNAEAHKALLKVLTALLGPEAAALAVVKAAIDALQSMDENRPWLALFERESRAASSARFQVATAQVARGGLLQVALAAFSLKTRSEITQVLFFKFGSSSTRLEYAAGQATIYEAALEGVRKKVAARLSEYRASFVAEVALAKKPARPRPKSAVPRPGSAQAHGGQAGSGSPSVADSQAMKAASASRAASVRSMNSMPIW
jgi:hypothetical protein